MKSNLPGKVSAGLTSWLPRDPISSLRNEMNELVNRFSEDFDNGWLSSVTTPSMDLAETDNQVEVKMDVPGMKAEELNIEILGNQLVVTGEHSEEKEEKDKTFHRVERRRGSIRRSITLPCPVQEAKIAAECRDGVLTVTLPKADEARKRKIPVKG
jgi:HSP20 family protein